MLRLLLWGLICYLGYRAARSALAVWKAAREVFPRAQAARRRPVEAEFEVEEGK